MRKYKGLLIFCLVILGLAICIAGYCAPVSKTYSVNTINIWQNQSIKDSITRQDSCSVFLKEYWFFQPKNGNYIPYLTIRFENMPTNGNSTITKNEYRFIFDDVISNIQTNKQMKSKLCNKAIAKNIILSDVNNAHVEMRLLRLSNNYKNYIDIISPIAGSALISNPIFSLVDTLLSKCTDAKDTNTPLIFQTDLYVPNSIRDYKENLKNGLPQLENTDYAIMLQGNTPVSDNSIKGRLSDLINKGMKFVCGTSLIDPKTFECDGAITLCFTNDTVLVPPDDLRVGLEKLDDGIRNITLSNKEIKEKAIELTKLTQQYCDQKMIDDNTKWSIGQYLLLVRALAIFRDNPESDWRTPFGSFCTTCDTASSDHNVQVIGVKDIYPPQKIAKVFLPYALSNDQISSACNWQVELHKSLMQQNILSYAVNVPNNTEEIESPAITASETP